MTPPRCRALGHASRRWPAPTSARAPPRARRRRGRLGRRRVGRRTSQARGCRVTSRSAMGRVAHLRPRRVLSQCVPRRRPAQRRAACAPSRRFRVRVDERAARRRLVDVGEGSKRPRKAPSSNIGGNPFLVGVRPGGGRVGGGVHQMRIAVPGTVRTRLLLDAAVDARGTSASPWTRSTDQIAVTRAAAERSEKP